VEEDQRNRILVIDDEVHLRNMVRRALEPEHLVFGVGLAGEALSVILAGDRFDLILCDLMLPQVTGMDFHEHVGAVAPELLERILFTTGGAYTAEAQAFLARPGIRHESKPFPPLPRFRAMIREYLARPAGIRSP
jgi:CheY-like chemotaxis protein